MHAVVRETYYRPGQAILDSDQFREFQSAHAEQAGYRGTVVVEAGEGRFLTLTLWETSGDADAARDTLGPVIGRLLNPLMTAPSKLLGTGPVVLNDLI